MNIQRKIVLILLALLAVLVIGTIRIPVHRKEWSGKMDAHRCSLYDCNHAGDSGIRRNASAFTGRTYFYNIPDTLYFSEQEFLCMPQA